MQPTLLRQKKKEDENALEKRNALQWIRAVLPNQDIPEDFLAALKSGVILCKLMNQIFPGSCTQFNNSVIPFMQMENSVLFLKAAEKRGLHKSNLFLATDLYHGRNLPAVFACLDSLSNLARDSGFKGPLLGKIERKSPSPNVIRKSRSAVENGQKGDEESSDEVEILYGSPPPADPSLLKPFSQLKTSPDLVEEAEEETDLVDPLDLKEEVVNDLMDELLADPLPAPKIVKEPEVEQLILHFDKELAPVEGGEGGAKGELAESQLSAVEGELTEKEERQVQLATLRRAQSRPGRRKSREPKPQEVLKLRGTFQRLNGTQTAHKSRTGMMRNEQAPTYVDYSGKRFNANMIVEAEEGEIVIRAGSLVGLVEALADRDIPDNRYIHDFFAIYDYFMDSLEVLDCLLVRYAYLPRKGSTERTQKEFDKWRPYIQLRVQNALIYWVDEHFHYFARDKEFREKFQQSLLSPGGIGDGKRGQILKEMYLMKIREFLATVDINEDGIQTGESAPVLLSAFPTATLRKGRLGRKKTSFNVQSYTELSFLKIPPLEIAHALVLLEKEFFDRIQPNELKTQNWRKTEKGFSPPSPPHQIQVGMEIVTTSTLKERVAVLQRFLEIVAELRRLNAFNPLMEVVSGLNQIAVKRLNKTWRLIPKKEMDAWLETKTLMAATSNSATYRSALEDLQKKNNFARDSEKKPAVPYIGLFIQDLTLLEELPSLLPEATEEKSETGTVKKKSSAEKRAQRLVNFKKMRRIATVLGTVRNMQRIEYKELSPNRAVAEWLVYGAQPLSESDLYKFSKLCEP